MKLTLLDLHSQKSVHYICIISFCNMTSYFAYVNFLYNTYSAMLKHQPVGLTWLHDKSVPSNWVGLADWYTGWMADWLEPLSMYACGSRSRMFGTANTKEIQWTRPWAGSMRLSSSRHNDPTSILLNFTKALEWEWALNRRQRLGVHSVSLLAARRHTFIWLMTVLHLLLVSCTKVLCTSKH
jgi:hypothetical protein